MLMPFGKYKGQDLSALPAEYLAWLGTIELREPLKSAALEEVERRTAEEQEQLIPSSLATPAHQKQQPHASPFPRSKRPRSTEHDGEWFAGGLDPQEIIRGDYPVSSRKR